MTSAILPHLRAPFRLLRNYLPTTRPSSQPRHAFSTGSGSLLAGHTSSITSRAIGYEKHGDPCEEGTLDVREYELPRLQKGQLRLRFEMSALNPADINVIQGVYPTKPTAQTINGSTFTVMGNEGTAIVEGFEEDGKVEHEFNVGDRVVMAKAQMGTWQTHLNAFPSELIRLPSSSHNTTSATRLTASQAATLCINPPTAFRILSDNLSINHASSSDRSQWLIQNGANSAVGQSVIQLARIWGINTINLVRARSTQHETESLKKDLKSLGADVVLTYDEFLRKGGPEEVKVLVGKDEGGRLKLALNCVGGDEIKGMLKVLDRGANLVTYGGMAKKGLTLSPSMFIFKDLTAKGFWLSNWVKQQNDNGQARLEMMHQLVSFIEAGQFVTPKVEIVSLGPKSGLSIEEAKSRVREVMKRQMEGRAKKVLFEFE
ncbi:BZ3500_MvSof-1268-A1-R1_Chr3-1g05447 [Microbotryum saponariae]|uniref:enoyl-[acyl-carrier-protein] reductase n=1 Tax=Microbotryum saponariae TaxID=289078 RepID=A0A2X0LHY2_9BASI|nr:BZ3500_MvSof-1268-A1-R1_Chr3-1g05447 [Microbotryum saponariae]SDA04638.1 BZ3501_MvSof-1269-A2-R1_Chr3-1g05118 [Microbotryum saponariae]